MSALSLIGELGRPTEACTPRLLLKHLPGLGDATSPFVDRAALRAKSEIFDASDMIYNAHWAARDASLRGTETPIDAGVVVEWHKAINWLTYYGDDSWDDVATDT